MVRNGYQHTFVCVCVRVIMNILHCDELITLSKHLNLMGLDTDGLIMRRVGLFFVPPFPFKNQQSIAICVCAQHPRGETT